MKGKKQLVVKLLDERSREQLEAILETRNKGFITMKFEKYPNDRWILDCSTLTAFACKDQKYKMMEAVQDIEVGVFLEQL